MAHFPDAASSHRGHRWLLYHRMEWLAPLVGWLLFVAIAGIFAVIRLQDFRDSIRESTRTQAILAIQDVAAQVSDVLNMRFAKLAVLDAMLRKRGQPIPSKAQLITTFAAFHRMHPDVTAVSLYDAVGNRILWSTMPPSDRRTGSPEIFVPLPGNADRSIGPVRHTRHAQAGVLSLRVRLRDAEGHTLGFIESPFHLDALRLVQAPPAPGVIILSLSGGISLGVWKDDRWMPPDTPIPRPAGAVSIPVSGYPSTVRAQWTQDYLDQALWSVEKDHLPRLVIVLLVVTALFLVIWIILRSYQREARRGVHLAEFNALLASVNQVISQAENEAALLQAFCDLAITHAHFKLAWIGRADAQGVLRFLAAAGATGYLDDVFISIRPDVPEGQGVAGLAWQSGAPVYNPSFTKNPAMRPWRERTRRFGLRSSATLPIYHNHAPAMVLTVYHEEENVFDRDLQNILEEMAKNIGYGLDRIDLLNRERTATVLKESLLANTTAGVALVRYPERIFIQVNQGLMRILGYQAEKDLVGHSTQEIFFDAETHERVGALYAVARAQGHAEKRDVPYKRANGTTVYLDISAGSMQRDQDGREILTWTLVDVTDRHRLAQQLTHQAHYDELTGLPNRRALDEEMDRAMARAVRHDSLLAVAMLDLDDFKPVNDTYGHEAGDQLLKHVARQLQEVLRETDFVARLGGDEFVLLVENLNNLGDLDQLLTKVQETVGAHTTLHNGESVQVTASMGVALYPFGDVETGDQLLRYADHALYESKARKVNREHAWVLFGEETRSTWRRPAQQLLDEGALEVWYQPILDNRVRKVVGVEALARLRDPQGKLWLPAEFLPQFQVDDLFKLSRKTLERALADLPILDAQGWSLWVSVNVDPSTVSQSCIDCLRETFARSVIDPSRVTLEILEGGDFLEQRAAVDYLFEIKALGVHLALDDVGSAYASLLRLKDLPIDKIKLDQGFVRTLEGRPQDLPFVAAIQDLAAGLGVTLVVEGVETDDILDAVTVMGVQFLQGYAIAKPMPLAELRKFLTQHQPSHHSPHPTGLYGLYVAQFAHHNFLKKAILQIPRLMDRMTLADAAICPIHADLYRLGFDQDSPLLRLHQEYHQAVAAMATLSFSSTDNADWSVVEQAQEAFGKAILTLFWKRRSEDGHPI